MTTVTTRRVVIGLGSNLGSRTAFLRAAIELLSSSPNVTLLSTAPVWCTAPLGPAQPDFLNTAVLIETTLTLSELLARCHEFEASLGRERRLRWGPRTIDLDLLWCDTETSDQASVIVPHPALRERAFALDPLLALVADARDPRDGTLYRAARDSLGTTMDQSFLLSSEPRYEPRGQSVTVTALDRDDALAAAIEATSRLAHGTPQKISRNLQIFTVPLRENDPLGDLSRAITEALSKGVYIQRAVVSRTHDTLTTTWLTLRVEPEEDSSLNVAICFSGSCALRVTVGA